MPPVKKLRLFFSVLYLITVLAPYLHMPFHSHGPADAEVASHCGHDHGTSTPEHQNAWADNGHHTDCQLCEHFTLPIQALSLDSVLISELAAEPVYINPTETVELQIAALHRARAPPFTAV